MNSLLHTSFKQNQLNQQNRSQQNKKIKDLTLLNLISGYSICIALVIICYQRQQNYILGSIILIDLAMIGYLKYANIKQQTTESSKDTLTQETQQQEQNVQTSPNELLYYEFTLQGLITTIYISIIEVMMEAKQEKQFFIITSMFAIMFINCQNNNMKNRKISFAFVLIQQLYTIMRLQIIQQFDFFSLIINIFFFSYQISHNKTQQITNQLVIFKNINSQTTTELVMRLYQSILSIIPEGIAVLNQDKQLLYANPTLKKILQCKSKKDIQEILMNLGSSKSKETNEQNKKSQTKDILNVNSSKIFNEVNEANNKNDFIRQKSQLNSFENSCKLLSLPFATELGNQLLTMNNENLSQLCLKKKKELKNNSFFQKSYTSYLNRQDQSKEETFSSVKDNHKRNSLKAITSPNNIKPYNPQKKSIHSHYKHSYSINHIDPNNTNDSIKSSSLKNIEKSSKMDFNSKKIQGLRDSQSQSHQPSEISEFLSYQGFGICDNKTQSLKEVDTQGQSNSSYSKNKKIKNQTNRSEQSHKQNSQYRINQQSKSQRKYLSEEYNIQIKQSQNDIKSPQNITQLENEHKIQAIIMDKTESKEIINFNNNRELKLQNNLQQNLKSLNQISNSQSQSNIQIQDLENILNINLKDLQQNNQFYQQQQQQQQQLQQQKEQYNQEKKQQQLLQNGYNSFNVQQKINKNNSSAKNQSKSETHIPIMQNGSNRERQPSASIPFSFKVKSKRNLDNQIIKEKTDFSHILDKIFGNSLKKFDESSLKKQKDGKTEDKKKYPQNISKMASESSKLDANPNYENQNSFLQQIQRKPDIDLNYIQHSENITKIQVSQLFIHLKGKDDVQKEKKIKYLIIKIDTIMNCILHLPIKCLIYNQIIFQMKKVKYKNKDLVIQFILIDVLTDHTQQNPLVLVMVQDMWQDLYLKKVEDIQKEKMRIFATLSHELRTPLNCSISMLEVLKDSLSSQEIYQLQIEEYLNPALFSNKLLLNQINDILDFVQMDSGKFKYSFFDFNILNLLYDVKKLISMQAQMKNLELLVSTNDESINFNICSDPNRIRQILLNFLSNSLKFTKIGYIELGIKYLNRGIYQLYVKDTGIGIKKENLETIFSFCNKVIIYIFLQLRKNFHLTLNNKIKIDYNQSDEELNRQGCGLGLTISDSLAKGLVKSEGIKRGISVESDYGFGSKFSILIENMNYNPLNEITQVNERDSPKDQKKTSKLNISSQLSLTKPQIRSQIGYQQTKKDIHSYINSSYIITEDEISFIDTQNATQNPLIFENIKLNLQQWKQLEGQKNFINTNNTSISQLSHSIQPVYIQESEKFGSADIIEEDEGIVHSIHHQVIQIQGNRNFQDEESMIEQKVLSPSQFSKYHSQKQSVNTFQTYSQFQQQNNDSINQVQPDFQNQNINSYQTQNSNFGGNSHLNNISSSNQKSQISNSNLVTLIPHSSTVESFNKYPDVIHSNILTIDERRIESEQINRRLNYISVNSNTKKSINSIKNLLENKDKNQILEQEGFNSYAPISKQIEHSSTQNLSNSSQNLERQNKTLQNFKSQLSQQISQNKNLDESCTSDQAHNNGVQQTPLQIVENILEFNSFKKLKCKCPQILIVDDNQFNLYALTKTIQQFQFSYCTAIDGDQALETIQKIYFQNCCQSPQMILMDIEMPGKNGYETTQDIIQFYQSVNYTHIPITVACTAYVGQEDHDKALQSGMDDFINKPILKQAFMDLIVNWSSQFQKSV